MDLNSTARFSNRVAEYVRYRPSYPPAVLALLQTECGLGAGSRIVDIGSGTGILSRIFLENGNPVTGVEPNAEMRRAAEDLLAGFPNFHSRNATAEDTGLPGGSADFVTAGQAFHWFDASRALPEFRRLLQPGGWIVLLWNERRTDSTPFLAAFERLLRTWGTDYAVLAAAYRSTGKLEEFLRPAPLRTASFENIQRFDFEGLHGRLLSASYIPRPGDPKYAPMLAEARQIFAQYQQAGEVRIEYDCRVYYGQPGCSESDTP